MGNKRITFRTTKLPKNSNGFKYNVQKYVNGYYAGVGRFCKTKKEVDAWKRKNK